MKSKDQQLLEEAYNKVRLSESNEAAALEKFASDLHEIWRAGWIKQNQGKSVPRMKKGSTGEQVDINVNLHADVVGSPARGRVIV